MENEIVENFKCLPTQKSRNILTQINTSFAFQKSVYTGTRTRYYMIIKKMLQFLSQQQYTAVILHSEARSDVTRRINTTASFT